MYLNFNSTPEQTIDAIYNGATITSEYQNSYKDYSSQSFDLYGLILAVSALASTFFSIFAKMTPSSLRLVSFCFALITGSVSAYYFKKNQDYYLNLVLPQEKAIEGILSNASSYLLTEAEDSYRNWDRNRYDQIISILNTNKSSCVSAKAWSEFRQACETYYKKMKVYN